MNLGFTICLAKPRWGSTFARQSFVRQRSSRSDSSNNVAFFLHHQEPWNRCKLPAYPRKETTLRRRPAAQFGMTHTQRILVSLSMAFCFVVPSFKHVNSLVINGKADQCEVDTHYTCLYTDGAFYDLLLPHWPAGIVADGNLEQRASGVCARTWPCQHGQVLSPNTLF